MAKYNNFNTSVSEDSEKVIKLLESMPLDVRELRQSIRPAALFFHEKMVKAVGTKWGIRTGRLYEKGVKLQIASKGKNQGSEPSAAYRIYFSKASNGRRGTPEYMAATYIARWLEGGTKPHYTVKGATIKKTRRGKIGLSAHQRKLKHPGFPARPAAAEVVEQEKSNVENIARNNIMHILKRKGVTDA